MELTFSAQKGRCSCAIYPGVDLSRFESQDPPGEPFRILFASAPLAERREILYTRGVELILRSLENLADVSFILLWRERCTKTLYDLVRRMRIDHSRFRIVNGVVPEVQRFLAGLHAVIAPYTRIEGNKACPNSLVEGLASGRPALASRMVGIADLIEKEEGGIVFEPTADGLVRGVETLRTNEHYRRNSRRVAERYFSKEMFIKRYQQLYTSLATG